MTIEMIETDKFNQGTQIKAIGVGGGGGNAIEHMIEVGVQGVEFICANTDSQALNRSKAHRIIQLGQTGLGAGNKPEKGREAAQQAEEQIRAAIEGANLLFITVGMGGGTGTGAAPVIAKIARDMGILTVAVVTKPFDFEGKRRMDNAEAGLVELEANVDSLIVVLNDKLIETLGADASVEECFFAANEVLRNAVGGIAEVIAGYAFMNVDFEDLCTVMSEPGKAIMGSALASGTDRARVAAEQALTSPLLEGVDLTDAHGVLVLVTGVSKEKLKMTEVRAASARVKEFADPYAHFIVGAAIDPTLGENIRVTVIATGLSRSRARPQAMTVIEGGLKTGTDDAPVMTATAAAATSMAMPQAGTMTSAQPVAATMPGYSASMPFAGGVATPVNAGSAADAPVAPAVWTKNHRTQASAKVNALASSGMPSYEIPAFLRKQAD